MTLFRLSVIVLALLIPGTVAAQSSRGSHSTGGIGGYSSGAIGGAITASPPVAAPIEMQRDYGISAPAAGGSPPPVAEGGHGGHPPHCEMKRYCENGRWEHFWQNDHFTQQWRPERCWEQREC
jgi:hypothetical protein